MPSRRNIIALAGAFLLCIATWSCDSASHRASNEKTAHAAGQKTPPADQLPLKPEEPCSEAPSPPIASFKGQLTPAQEHRAMGVYQQSIVITAHDHCFHPGDFKDMELGGITVRAIKLTTDGIYWRCMRRYLIESEVDGWKNRGQIAIQILNQEIAASHGKIIVVRKVEDILRAKREHKLGVIMSFEGGRPLEGKIENLRMFYDLGLRDLQLFWAVPSPLKTPEKTLAPFGQDVVHEMNHLGIVVDLSHMKEEAFNQAVAITQRPVIISHCAVAAVTGAGRGGGTDQLDDGTIRAIAKNGGAICLHFYQGYIRPHHGTRSTVEDLVDNMDYIKKLVGVDYVALGADYFPEKGYPWIQGAEMMRDMPNVAREMVRRGYTGDEIQKVLGLNLMRIYRQVWQP